LARIVSVDSTDEGKSHKHILKRVIYTSLYFPLFDNFLRSFTIIFSLLTASFKDLIPRTIIQPNRRLPDHYPLCPSSDMEAATLDSVSFSVLDAIPNRPGRQYAYYRILVASSAIKYLAFLPPKPIFAAIPDVRGERLGFTVVPRGDWNVGHLEHDTVTDRLVLQSTEKRALQGVADVWHLARVDCLSLGDALPRDELQCALKMNAAIYPGQFGASQVVVNMECYPDDIFGVIQETRVHSQIDGHGIGPKFLGHVTENTERVCGYMLESLPARPATIDDLQTCKSVLAKLHDRKIVYGHLSSQSFLIVDGQALLHGFGGSFATDHQPLFEREMDSVEDVLRRGSPSTQHLSDELYAEIFAISQRDDGVHPEVIRQAAEHGKITITEEEHRGLLRALQEGIRETQRYTRPFKAIINKGAFSSNL
jgi:hypothetical protein